MFSFTSLSILSLWLLSNITGILATSPHWQCIVGATIFNTEVIILVLHNPSKKYKLSVLKTLIPLTSKILPRGLYRNPVTLDVISDQLKHSLK